MTEQQQREACAELARRMGWTQRRTTDIIAAKLAGDWIRPDGSFYDREGWPPDYFTDADASRELVLWLAKQERSIQREFVFALREATDEIARAACKALGIAIED